MAIGLFCGAAVGTAPAFATAHPGSPGSTFAVAYLDSSRCRVLSQQIDQLKAARGLSDKASVIAAQGLDLCRAGSFAAGADRLAAAVRMTGAVPAAPQPIVRLR
ncbi:MAG: hypothetical protein JO128_21745 [Alphaproteobacteria bacterium]|nr:hypothetical protein [Alphaproteobacteria bacterium]